MAVLYERTATELSVIRAERWTASWTSTLSFCRNDIVAPGGYRLTSDDDLLYDLLMKGLLRGERSFVDYLAERAIVSVYGGAVGIQKDPDPSKGSIG